MQRCARTTGNRGGGGVAPWGGGGVAPVNGREWELCSGDVAVVGGVPNHAGQRARFLLSSGYNDEPHYFGVVLSIVTEAAKSSV